jgi:dolichol-phosphate hexosyltransferase
MGRNGGEWGLRPETMREPPTIGERMVPLPSEPEAEPISPLTGRDVENPRSSTLSILLPALNEEAGIEKVLQDIPRRRLERLGLAYKVFLLDGHSTDRTRSLARSMGAEVVIQSGNGKGAAFREFLPKIKADITVLLDSDGTYPPEMIPELVGALGDQSPVVLGSRLLGSRVDDGAMSPLNYVGNRLLSSFASLLFEVPVSDVCSGMWAFRSDQLKSLALAAERFELEAEFFAECALRRIPIAEIPIPYRKRIGQPKLRLRDGLWITFALLKKRMRSSLGVADDDRMELQSPTVGPAHGGG